MPPPFPLITILHAPPPLIPLMPVPKQSSKDKVTKSGNSRGHTGPPVRESAGFVH
ncbi:hypothetical protein LX36DRAFT_658933 [Colletotrichum falcatum]|nr:hypothetical protein LX36DRAFT_658933 [Colletotrichum falcatum]